MKPFAQTPEDAVSTLGETRLIHLIRQWLGSTSPKSPAGIGDDCAVVSGSPRLQLITVDPVIYREHFDDSIPARGVGEKLFKRNLSDVAAMGGRARAAVIALALDEQVSVPWLADFYRGLARVARRYHVPVIGGDVARHQGGLVATLTLLGEATTNRAVTRVGARPRDWIYVTGRLGGSLLGHHWKFTPRMTEGAWLAARPEVRALMDVSDGIAKDLSALTPTGCVARVRSQSVPISAAARRLARQTGRSPLAHALSDGEDYELLFVVDGRTDRAAFEAEWKKAFRLKLSCLGRFEQAASSSPSDEYINWADHHGYEHLG